MRMAQKRLPEPFEVSVTVDGKRFTGYYVVESNVVTVTYRLRRSSTQIGGATARLVAGTLLRELVDAADKKQAG
jgi:hypothetical protein